MTLIEIHEMHAWSNAPCRVTDLFARTPFQVITYTTYPIIDSVGGGWTGNAYRTYTLTFRTIRVTLI